MKTPESWRTSHDPCCKVPLPESPFAMMDRHTQINGSVSITLTAYYICIRSHLMISRTGYWVSCARPWNSCQTLFTRDNDYTANTQVKLPEITFFYLVTLTYDLDHRTWPRYYKGASPYQNSCPYVKRFSRESAELQTDTHTHTGPILLLWSVVTGFTCYIPHGQWLCT